MIDISFHFDSVIVVDSMRTDEPRTGISLYRDTVLPLAARNGIKHYLIEANDAGQMVHELDQAAARCESEHSSTMLHLEVHGAETGLLCRDGSLILWSELERPMARLNIAGGCNLVVTTPACHGQNLKYAMHPLRPTPLWVLIGCSEEVSSGLAIDGFAAFYSILLETFDAGRAWRALQSLAKKQSLDFTPIDAIHFLELVVRHYVSVNCTEESVGRRFRHIKTAVGDGGGLPPHLVEHRDQWLKSQLESRLLPFDLVARTFLMIDRYPQLRNRFAKGIEQARDRLLR